MRNPNWQAMEELQTLRCPRLTVGAAFVNQFLVFGCFFSSVGRGKGFQVCLCSSPDSVTLMTFKFSGAGTEGAAAEQASLSAAVGRASWSVGTVMRPGRPLPRLAANKAH